MINPFTESDRERMSRWCEHPDGSVPYNAICRLFDSHETLRAELAEKDAAIHRESIGASNLSMLLKATEKERDEARRLLDEARKQEPVAWRKGRYLRSNETMADTPEVDDGLIRYGWEPLYAAPVPQPAVPDDVARDYPEGWVFHSADFSMNASCASRYGRVTLVRDAAGRDRWIALSDEEKERQELYAYGYGKTLAEAIRDASNQAAILSATDSEVEK